jgi:hypothetical protein
LRACQAPPHRRIGLMGIAQGWVCGDAGNQVPPEAGLIWLSHRLKM